MKFIIHIFQTIYILSSNFMSVNFMSGIFSQLIDASVLLEWLSERVSSVA